MQICIKTFLKIEIPVIKEVLKHVLIQSVSMTRLAGMGTCLLLWGLFSANIYRAHVSFDPLKVESVYYPNPVI